MANSHKPFIYSPSRHVATSTWHYEPRRPPLHYFPLHVATNAATVELLRLVTWQLIYMHSTGGVKAYRHACPHRRRCRKKHEGSAAPVPDFDQDVMSQLESYLEREKTYPPWRKRHERA